MGDGIPIIISMTISITVGSMCVCVERLCSRRRCGLDCHGGAMGTHHCAVENITVLFVALKLFKNSRYDTIRYEMLF